ncbi:MAG TPA: amino acid ABC transporter permease [Thermomicrobiales bacterium]|nr:amino acid ABC transporter permease [Thermomicrobiales bacterium]
MRVVIDNADLIWIGLKLTLELSVVIIVLSTLFGTLVGVGLVYGNFVVRSILRLYVDVIRGIPLLVLIFLIFYGLPALQISVFGHQVNTNIGRFETATLAFSLFAAAHVGEIVRGALAAVPAGQTDAAKAIGLTFWPRLRHILLPQSIPVILPPWTNTAAELVKGTSLVTLVSMSDLMFATRKIAERTGDVIPLYSAAAIIYFVICFTISRAGVWLSGRYRYGVAR